MKFLVKLRAYSRLGVSSIFDVLVYRIGLKTGLHPVLKIAHVPIPVGDYFGPFVLQQKGLAATPVWQGRPWAFGRPIAAPSNDPPDWHANIVTGARVPNPQDHWHMVATFSDAVGDIKTVWEASRFDWVLAFAQNIANGDAAALNKLNIWLSDWVEENPAYYGPNWICGQETSFRIAHLAIAASILGQLNAPTDALLALVLNHLRRIYPTTSYARGQDNNHATSEAMALFIGGLWLARCSFDADIKDEAAVYVAAGRALMEERVRKLIFPDGGFAQYSIVYHRLMLDSLAITEYFRNIWGVEKFSDIFYEKARSTTDWLAYFTDPITGDVPNLGSNDGAWLLPIGSGDYRDFRPACALASTLFDTQTHFADAETANELLLWLGIEPKPLRRINYQLAKIFADSGIAALNCGKLRIFVRLPGYKFRPHQSDALHVDVWHDGHCLLQDAGTFSYAAEGWQYFPSTAAHNNIEFDNRDQMPRLGRFLYGEWLQRGTASADKNMVVASYTDYCGATHRRTIIIHDERNIEIIDEISGKFDVAILRWRPTKPLLQTNENEFANDVFSLSVIGDTSISRQQIVPHKASKYYQQSTDVSALETELTSAGKLVTVITIL